MGLDATARPRPPTGPGAWTTFQSHEKTWAYQQDQLPSTHPVYADIRDLDDVLVNFDGITYAKGGAILKQLVAYVGIEPFVAGLRTYFAKYAWGNTRFADLLAELEAASGRDLGPWTELWLKTAGVNTLTLDVATDADGVITSAAVLQTAADAYPTLRPHRIAIGRYALEDGKLVRVGRHELDVEGPRTEVPELVGLAQPDVLLPNDDDLSYAKLRFDERSYATLLEHTADFAESLPRSLVIGAFWEMVREGEMPARDFVDLLLASLATETHPTVIRTILQTTKQIPSQLLTSATLFSAPEHREETQAKVAEALRKMAEDAEPGSDRQLQMVGAFGRAARSADDIARLRAAFDGSQPYPGLELDQDMRWALLSALAALGDATDEEIAAELARDDTNAGRERAFHARAARPTAEAKAEAWRLAVEEDGQPNAVIEALTSGWNRAARPVDARRLRAAVLRRPAAGVELPVRGDPRAAHRQGVPAGVLPARARRPGARRDDRGVARRQRGRARRRCAGWSSRSWTPRGPPWSPSSATRSVLERLNALAAHLVPTALPEPWQTLVGVPAAHRPHRPGRRAASGSSRTG